MGRARRRQLGGVDRLPSGRWRVRLVDPSTGQRLSIGSFKTKAQAEVAFAGALADQQRGAWVAPNDGRITFGDYYFVEALGRYEKTGNSTAAFMSD